MIDIVIVEDDNIMQKKLKDIVLKVIFPLNIKFAIKLYHKFDKELEQLIKDGSMKKIYILDIELPNSISGIKIAEKIRQKDWESEIIFLSNHDQMREQVFSILNKIFCFIPKFHNLEEELSKNLNKILEHGYDNDMLYYSNRKISLRLYYKDITHIIRDKEERKLIIKTTSNKYIIKLTIEEVLERLDKRFKQVHRSCIANTKRITEYNWAKGYFTLDTKESVLALSKQIKKEVMQG